MKAGTKVENQTVPPTLTGTVIGPSEGLPGFVDVRWSDGRTFSEQERDLTVIDGPDVEPAPRQRTALATQVVSHRPTGVTRLRDVPVVVDHSRGKTFVVLGSTRDHGVTIILTEAERIAFIEALGGKA